MRWKEKAFQGGEGFVELGYSLCVWGKELKVS